jgi:hypothetical protein
MCLLIGHDVDVSKYHEVMDSHFECDNISKLKEYVGCKIKNKKRG